MGRQLRAGLGLIGSLTLLIGWAAAPSLGATTTAIADWGAFGGSSGAFTTTMQLDGLGYPAAAVTTDSRSGQVGVQSGASVWWSAATPPGQRFGSSRDRPYVNLRPRADNAGAPSVTTYSFDRPTPLGWGFVVGDIDADQVTVTATLADASPAAPADLGFRGVFNVCDVSPRPSGCPGPMVGDVPTWDPATATLTGNTAAADSFGASGWFEPQVPLRSLTLTFAWRAGLPIYQTWFASRRQDVMGEVALVEGDCAVTDVRLRLLAADGTVLATTTPRGDGSYEFSTVAATDDFRVELLPGPTECQVVGPDSRGLDLTAGDDSADFTVRGPVEVDVTGEVIDEDGEGVPAAVVDITGDDVDDSVTTDQDGEYVVPDLPPGDYTFELDPPDGFVADGPDEREVRVNRRGEVVGPTDFTVVSTTPAPNGAGPQGGVLPSVGASAPRWVLLAGLGLAGTGIALVVTARRRPG